MSDLTQAQDFAESQLVDRCRVDRDVGGFADDTLDLATGKLVRPAWDVNTIYVGPCLLGAVPRGTGDVEPGGIHSSLRYRIRFPFDSPELALGDVVEITESPNAQIVGMVLRVDEILASGRIVTRRYHCHLDPRAI